MIILHGPERIGSGNLSATVSFIRLLPATFCWRTLGFLGAYKPFYARHLVGNPVSEGKRIGHKPNWSRCATIAHTQSCGYLCEHRSAVRLVCEKKKIIIKVKIVKGKNNGKKYDSDGKIDAVFHQRHSDEKQYNHFPSMHFVGKFIADQSKIVQRTRIGRVRSDGSGHIDAKYYAIDAIIQVR